MEIDCGSRERGTLLLFIGTGVQLLSFVASVLNLFVIIASVHYLSTVERVCTCST